MKRLVAISLFLICACRSDKRAVGDDARVSTRRCVGVQLDAETFEFRENTPNELSSMLFVGADILRRNDGDLSALAIVTDLEMKHSERRTVSAGDVVSVGADRYCVIELRATATTGFISLRRVLGPM